MSVPRAHFNQVRRQLSPTISLLRLRNFLSYWKEFGFLGAVDIAKAHSRSTVLQVRVRGFRHRIHVRTNGSDFAILRQILGRCECLPKKRSNIQTIVDCGANVGYSALVYHRAFPDAMIVAIEPQRDNFAVLCHNVEPIRQVNPVLAGVWPCDGLLEIVNPESAACAYRTGSARVETDSAIEGISLPTLMRRFGLTSIDLLKLDIEGAEDPLFAENTDWIRTVRNIVIEFHPHLAPTAKARMMGLIQNSVLTHSTNGEYDIYELEPRV